jgi:molecular chaperone HscB
MQWSVRINEAFHRLADPLSRATYLCELAGHRLDPHDNQAMPPAFLLRQMQWHDALTDAPSSEAVRTIDDEVNVHLDALREAVGSDLDERHDASAALPKLREWMFLKRLRAEIERRLESLEA